MTLLNEIYDIMYVIGGLKIHSSNKNLTAIVTQRTACTYTCTCTYTIITRADDVATRQRNNVRTVRHSGEVVLPDSIIRERVFICAPAALSEFWVQEQD